MKKVFLCFIAFAFLSCSSDDGNSPIMNENAIHFNLNGVDYSLTDYEVMMSPTNIEYRIVEATFDNETKTLFFSVLEEETNQIDEFILIENDVYYSSDPIYGDRETSITTHTDAKMEGTFRVTLKDTNDRPLFTFKNGMIDIEY
ncbi:hypothetical protein H2O64_06080 [Kordia sp. YSTF-M3]|uniref:DUF4625 domain-containing protein n=1 Tax=Kordia aestuariivivens TaxID=2759037 RepID=A0ABR7Q6N3_9FLAO|nr:hypothetical protein [Kordia aestuariivivens]MBC8754232.1 hypothetical protein [Kordia aestuariivivens]